MTDDDKALVERLRDESIVGMPMENEAADRIEAQAARIAEWDETGRQLTTKVFEQAAEIERLREALKSIAAECSLPVGTDKQMYARWRKLAVERVDIARAALGETE